MREVVEHWIGAPVVRSLSQAGGFTSGLASRLILADGRRVFVKGLPSAHPLAGTYRAEAAVSSRLPEAAPSPRLLHLVEGQWVVLVFADVDGREPNLRPGSPDLAAVLTALGSASRTLTPCPLDDVPSVLDDLGPLLRGWTSLHATATEDLQPWVLAHLDSLAAMETAWHPWAEGDTLLHNDLRVDNMIRRVDDGRVLLVDWSYPSRGAAWLDTAVLVPQLLLAGHQPAEAERLVLTRPCFAGVPAWAVTGFAAALAGHWELSSRLPEPSGSLGLRTYQARAAAAALAWVASRTRW
ncbi:hypothetical protein GCM10010174_35340 [Kutzneria viridogrisea]